MEENADSELYWSTLEKIYVHNVYENISSKYDEFLKLSSQNRQKKRNNSYSAKSTTDTATCEQQNEQTSLAKQISDIDLTHITNETHTNTPNDTNNTSKHHRTKSEKSNHAPKQLKHNAWPKVKNFLLQLEANSLVADIGCGEGKYLNVNSKLFSIGCDRSSSLSQLALSKYAPTAPAAGQNQVMICDNLAIPFK